MDRYQETWDELGRTDPFWAVLSSSTKTDNRLQPEDFFATGVTEIESLMEYLDSLGVSTERQKALDFGCGLGRLTSPLTKFFATCTGVDISGSFIELAKKYHAKNTKCTFLVNRSKDLAIFNDNEFDLIYSNIVLQHMRPAFSLNYIHEFLRILKTKGILVFQVPRHRISLVGRFKQAFKEFCPDWIISQFGEKRIMEMHGIREKKLTKFVQKRHGRIIDIVEDQAAGYDWKSYRYCIRKHE